MLFKQKAESERASISGWWRTKIKIFELHRGAGEASRVESRGIIIIYLKHFKLRFIPWEKYISPSLDELCNFLPTEALFRSCMENHKSRIFPFHPPMCNAKLFRDLHSRANQLHPIRFKTLHCVACRDLWANEAHKNINKNILCWFIEAQGVGWKKCKKKSR